MYNNWNYSVDDSVIYTLYNTLLIRNTWINIFTVDLSTYSMVTVFIQQDFVFLCIHEINAKQSNHSIYFTEVVSSTNPTFELKFLLKILSWYCQERTLWNDTWLSKTHNGHLMSGIRKRQEMSCMHHPVRQEPWSEPSIIATGNHFFSRTRAQSESTS